MIVKMNTQAKLNSEWDPQLNRGQLEAEYSQAKLSIKCLLKKIGEAVDEHGGLPVRHWGWVGDLREVEARLRDIEEFIAGPESAVGKRREWKTTVMEVAR